MCDDIIEAQTVLYEDCTGGGKLETDVSVIKLGVPFMSNRATINTKYEFWDYKGRKDEHLVLFSSKENEKLWDADEIGSDLVDGKKVLVLSPLAGYFIRPIKSEDKNVPARCKVTYLLLSERTCLPDWIARKIIPKIFANTARKIVQYVAEKNNCEPTKT